MGQLLSKNSSEIVLKWFQAKSRLAWDLLSEFGSIVDSRNKFKQKNFWRHEKHSKFRISRFEAIFKPNLLQSELVKVRQLLSKTFLEIVLKWFQAKSRLGWDLLSEFESIVDSRNDYWRKNSWRHERHWKFRISGFEAIFKPNLLQSGVVKVCQLLSKTFSEIVLK